VIKIKFTPKGKQSTPKDGQIAVIEVKREPSPNKRRLVVAKEQIKRINALPV
jgi:hypothetical protein